MKSKSNYFYKLWLASILLFSMLQATSAQSSPEEYEYTPAGISYVLPSPSSQEYQRFMGFQPELATGAVNVTIPLHTLTFDDFSLPLNLNYQSNGIKRDAPYFPLGYGWVLHPGLQVTRTVLGKPDETAPDKHYLNVPESDACYFKNLEEPGRMDPMYDVFTLSLPQGQANFLIEGTSTSDTIWQAITAMDLYKIEARKKRLDPYFCEFRVTDEHGIIYYFGGEGSSELTSDYIVDSRQGGSYVPTTFLLRKAVLPGNHEVLFDWNVDNSTSPQFEEYYRAIDGGYNYTSVVEMPDSHLFEDSDVHSYLADGPTVRGCNLNTITLPNGRIEFLYNGDGLRNIRVSDKQNKTVKSIMFEITNRLLQDITVNNNEKYSLAYNQMTFGGTYDRDFWGYYNGAGNRNYCAYPTFSYKRWGERNLSTVTSTIEGADRKPNAEYMQANMLEQVNYPTGGYTRFEYEPHTYKTANRIVAGGGLRVKKVISGTNGQNEDRQITKSYKYGADECGHGSCSVHIDENAFVSESFVFYHIPGVFYSYRCLTIHANHLYSGYLMFNLPIWYGTVTEYTQDGGRTIYKYDYIPDDMAECSTDVPNSFYPRFPAHKIQPLYYRTINMKSPSEYYHIFDRSPLLVDKQTYNATGEKIIHERNTYQACKGTPMDLRGINFAQMAMDVSGSNRDDRCYPYARYDYVFASIRTSLYLLDTQTITENGVTTTKTYRYKSNGIPSRIITNHSSDTAVEEHFLYADDDLSGLTAEQRLSKYTLQDNHRNTLPVWMGKSVDGEMVAQKAFRYSASTNTGRKYVYPLKEFYSVGTHPEETRVEYLSHNSCGKPLEVVEDGRHTVYLWGYLSQYPIARIENATYDEVKAIIGETMQEAIATGIIPTDSQWNAINALRLQLPNAQVSTYTYQPMQGMLSETNPAGESIYYTYDSSGRLTEKYRQTTGTGGTQVKEIIENYEYKYKE